MTENMNKTVSYEAEIEGRNSLIRKVYRDGYQYATNVIHVSEGQEPKGIFCNYEQPEEIYEKTKKAEKDFHEILRNVMGEEKLPQRLQLFLQTQKVECAAVLREYDGIILELKASLKKKDKDYRIKMEKQRVQRDLLQRRVENFMSELANAGRTEIAALRETIVKRTKDASDESWKKINEFFDDRADDKAFDSQLWIQLSDMITSQQMQDAFLSDQKEIFELRRKLFADVCKLRSELEKQKAEYNLNKEKLEQGLFDIKKSYGKNIPLLARMKREYVFLTDKKAILLRKLKEVKEKIAVEHRYHEEDYLKLNERIVAVKESNRINHDRTAVKYYQVFKVRNTEAEELLNHITDSDKIIHENILKVSWCLSGDMPKTKLKESDSGTSLTSFEPPSENSSSNLDHKMPKDDLVTSPSSACSAASDTTIEDVDWETLLHCISDEMGFILDHRWVEYFKTALPKEKAVFTLGEVFKMFKVRPEEDLIELKDNMLPHCKYVDSETGALHIDHKGVLEGFRKYLNDIQKKRKKPEFPEKYASVLKYQEDYWNSFLTAMPKIQLWDAVLEGLEQYLSYLKTRSKLLNTKSSLMLQNSELERCLAYYGPYGRR